MDAQLQLRGQSYDQLTAKPLYANPAGPKPEKRTDGYQKKGPQGLQNIVTSKLSYVMEKVDFEKWTVGDGKHLTIFQNHQNNVGRNFGPKLFKPEPFHQSEYFT